MTVEKGERREVFSKVLNRVEPLDVVLLAQETLTCMGSLDGKGCGGKLVVPADDSGEYVCIKCGRVWGRKFESEHIPFSEGSDDGESEGSYQPETNLEFGKGLGSKMDRLSSSNVLRGAKNTSNETFLNSRGRMARVPLCDPLLKEMLSYGSFFCDKQELHQRGNGSHARFADQLGIHLRLIAEFYVKGLGKMWADPWRITASVFTLLFKEWYPERYGALRTREDSKQKFPELCLPDDVVRYFGLVLKTCNPPVLPQLP